MYKNFLIDIDGTLQYYRETEREVLKEVLEGYGAAGSAENISATTDALDSEWGARDLNSVAKTEIQKNYHPLYKEAVVAGLKKAASTLFPDKRCDDIFERYLNAWKNHHIYVEGVPKTLLKMRENSHLYVVSNGLHILQLAKLVGIVELFDKIYISEDVGAIKPQKEFFSRILSDIGASADECLMIGDSPSADMKGAASVGMDFCLISERRAKYKEAKYSVRDFNELSALLGI